MDFIEKLNALLKEKGISRAELAKNADIPYTTIVSLYEKGYQNVKLSTLRRLASYFRCSLDYLTDDSISDRYFGVTADYANGRTKHKNAIILEGDLLPPELQGLDIKLEVIKAVADSGLNEKEIKLALKLYKLYSEDYTDDHK